MRARRGVACVCFRHVRNEAAGAGTDVETNEAAHVCETAQIIHSLKLDTNQITLQVVDAAGLGRFVYYRKGGRRVLVSCLS